MLRRLYEKYGHLLLLFYFPFYMAVFTHIEKVVPEKIHIINCVFDQYIPFCEYFVIPYLLWFAYMGAAGLFFMFRDKEAFCKLMYMGMIGMTTFLLVSILYPNGLEIRPTEFARDNIFVELTKYIYNADPARNVLPSIHVFNSVGTFLCIRKSKSLKDNRFVNVSAFILTVAIVFATMFLKQHSMFDVLSALVLVTISYDIVYDSKTVKLYGQIKSRISTREAGKRKHTAHDGSQE